MAWPLTGPRRVPGEGVRAVFRGPKPVSSARETLYRRGMGSGPVVSAADGATVPEVAGGRGLAETTARCEAALAAAEENVRRARAALAIAEERLRRAQGMQARAREHRQWIQLCAERVNHAGHGVGPLRPGSPRVRAAGAGQESGPRGRDSG